MSKTPNYDAKIKTILDNLQPGERTCEMTGETWMMDEEEIGWYKTFQVPPSTFSPKARLWLMGSFFLVYQWWWNKHFDTGEPVLTSAHPASGIRVLPDKEWFNRDFSETHQEIDLVRPFFDQFRDLQVKIPINATRNLKEPENSITMFSMGDKNSYFVASGTNLNSVYTNDCQNAESSLDCMASIDVTDCFRVNHSSRLHRCKFVNESYDCIDSAFLFDCRNCEFCFGASNKRNKKYLWWNEQLSKDEWEKRMQEVKLGSFAELENLQAKFYEMIKSAVWPENFNVKTSDSTGEYMIECSGNVKSSYGRHGFNNYWCFGMWNAQGNAFSCAVPGDHNYGAGPNAETSNSKFSAMMIRCDDAEYSFNCYDCSHIFGCVGLRHKKFHIFNKPYSEEEYWQKLDALKVSMLERNEYGRPFPASFSPSYYPESGPMLYLGASPDDWDTIGFARYDIEEEGAFGEMRLEGKRMYNTEELPDHIDEVTEDWLGKPIFDTGIKRPYTILKPELAFYKKHDLPLPRKHFTARMRDLLWEQNSAVLEEVACTKCSKGIMVATNRTWPERTIYCQECYLQYLEQYG